MAVTRVQFAGAQNGAGGPYSVVLNPTAVGNLLVVCVSTYDNFDQTNFPDIQDNLGTQYSLAIDYFPNVDDRLTVFYVPLCPAGITNIRITDSMASNAIAIEYNGLMSLVDTIGTSLSQIGTSWIAPAIRVGTAGVLLAFASTRGGSGVTFAATGGFALVAEQDNATNSSSSCVIDQLNAAPGTYTPSGTTASSLQIEATTLSFK